MNIKFERAVDRFVGVPICALLSLIARFGGEPPAPAAPPPPPGHLLFGNGQFGPGPTDVPATEAAVSGSVPICPGIRPEPRGARPARRVAQGECPGPE